MELDEIASVPIEPSGSPTSSVHQWAQAPNSLPRSIEFEKNLLSGCLNDPAEILPRASRDGISPESFFEPSHGVVFGQMVKMLEAKLPIDLVTLAHELKASGNLERAGGLLALSHLSASAPNAEEASYLIDQVAALAARRELVNFGWEIARRASDPSVDVCETLDCAKDGAQRLRANGGSGMSARLEELRLDPNIEPPALREVFALGKTVIGTPGNIVSTLAQAKAGKTAFIGAAIGSTMGTSSDCDFLGLSGQNPSGLAVVHVDTEQASHDHYKVIRTSMRRAHLEGAPKWLHSYATAGLSPSERRRLLPHMLKAAKAEYGGIHSVFLDGVADFVNDPNDGKECFAFVDWLQAQAVKYDCPIFAVLHHNPNSEKGRGHLGSQLERRSETNLMLEKDSATGRTVVYSTKQRRAPIPKADGPCFRWDDQAVMHVTVQAMRAERDEQDREALIEVARDSYADCTSRRMRYTDLVKEIEKAARCKERTAEEKVKKMKRFRIIVEVPPRLLELVV